MKKILALAVSLLVLIAMMPSVMAANATAVVLYEPDLLENLNGKSGTLGSPAIGGWSAFSGARASGQYVKDDLGNVYLKIVDAAISGNSTNTTGDFGAYFQFAENAATGENVTVEMKVKIPATEMNKKMEIRFKGDYAYGNTPIEHPEANAYSSGVYIVSHIEATDNGYIYTDNYSNGERKSTVAIAPYNNQWINLKWVFDTTSDSYDLYCNSEKILSVSDASFYPEGVITGSSNVIPSNIKYVQVCLPNGTKTYAEDGKTLISKASDGGEIWIDDIIFDVEPTTDVPLSAVIPAFDYFENDTVNTGLVNVELLNSDGTAYGKEIGLIIPDIDTSMVGNFVVPVENVSGIYTSRNVYRKSNLWGYTFDETDNASKYTPSNSNNFNAIVPVLGSNALKIGIGGSGGTRNYEDMPIANVTENKDIVEISYDIFWEKPVANTTFYSRLYSGAVSESNFVIDILFTFKTDGTYNVNCDAEGVIMSGALNESAPQRIKYIIDKKEESIKFYINDVFKYEYTGLKNLANAKKEYKTLRFYTYPNPGKDTDVYIDNLFIKGYESVASVDTAGAAEVVTVVKNQIPDLAQTVTSILTDGTTDILPVKWAAVDTATTGEKSVTGTVFGLENTTVEATVNVIALPYIMNVSDGTITITAPTDYTPEGKLYIATYEGGVLKNVNIYDELVAGTTTVNVSGDVKVFLITDELVPLAEAVR